MPAGDVTIFDAANTGFFDGTHDLDTHIIKCAVITDATIPTAADVTPNLSDYTEVTNAGSYTAGGIQLTITVTGLANVATIASSVDPNWTTDPLNSTNAFHGLIYNETASGAAIGFAELGGPINMQSTALVINWDDLGIFTNTAVGP